MTEPNAREVVEAMLEAHCNAYHDVAPEDWNNLDHMAAAEVALTAATAIIQSYGEAVSAEKDRRIAELEAALAPFSDALGEWGDEEGQPDRWNTWEHPIAFGVSLGDFRQAKSVLTRTDKGEG